MRRENDQTFFRRKKLKDSSSGVSEVIGAILLISVGVLAVAIIAAGLFSQPLPQKIPSISAVSMLNGTTLTIYHNGGDPLFKGEFYIKVGNQLFQNINPASSNIWSEGTSIILPNVQTTSPVQIFYITGSGDILLDQMQVQTGSKLIPDVLPTPTPSPCQPGCGITNCTQEKLIQIGNDIADNSTVFLRNDQKADLVTGGYLSFRVTNSSSNIFINGVPYQLYVGDIIKITLLSNSQDFKIYGIGDKFYELRGKGVNITRKYAVNGTEKYFPNDVLNNAWITGYTVLQSDFTISSDPNNQNPYTLLAKNGTTTEINGNSNKIVTISGIRPMGVGLFVLDGNSQSQTGTFFVGRYGSISY
jgi:hypothetical protein